MPLYQREAVWIAFQSRPSCPHAIEVGIGGVNAVSGDSWNKSLNSAPKNYLVSPPQPWFDGINVGEVKIRQFVAMPLGLGYTVEEQLTVDEAMGGIQIRVFAPKPGRFPAGSSSEGFMATNNSETVSENTPMGLAAGGIIEQGGYPAPYGVETWNLDDHGVISIHIVNTNQYARITGNALAPPSISAQTYTEYGLPWFRFYDAKYGDIHAPNSLTEVMSVRKLDEGRGIPPDEAESPLGIDPRQIRLIGKDSKKPE